MRQLFGKEAKIIQSELEHRGFKQKETGTYRNTLGVSVRLLRDKYILSARSSTFELRYAENKTVDNTLEAIRGVVSLFNSVKKW